MIFYILSNHFFRYLVPNRPCKISIFPKLSSPKLFLYLRMFLKYYTATYTLQYPHYLGNTIPRRKRKKNMNVISCYLQYIYLKIVIPGNLLKNFLYPISNIIPQYPLSIFRCPYQMIFRIVYRMTGSHQFHALTITHFSLPSAGELFIPVYKTGYSSSNLT